MSTLPQFPDDAFAVFDDPGLREKRFAFRGKNYVLIEASEAAACKWRDHSIAGARMQDGQVTGVRDIANSEPLLVSLCLYNANDDGGLPLTKDGEPDNNRRVAFNALCNWGSRFVKPLFEWVKDNSDLTEGDPLRDEVTAALSLPESPVSLESLQSFARALTDEGGKFRRFKLLFKPLPGERAKNAPGATTDSSV